MTLRKIAILGHPVLRQVARFLSREEIVSQQTQQLIDDMIETMRDVNGAGIAAPQVYESVQICVIEVGNNPRYPYKPPIPLTVMLNPVMEYLSEETFENYEGCLSVPQIRGRVRRSVKARISFLDRHAQPCVLHVQGLSAGTFQHELDHLQGKLFVDKVFDPRSLCTWEHFEKFEKEAFVDEVKKLVSVWGS
jgi:peptide deformylase